MFFDITMLPDINLPRFAEYDLENRSLFDSLRTRYQIVVTGGTQQLFAIRADKRLQEYLNVRAGHPVPPLKTPGAGGVPERARRPSDPAVEPEDRD